MDRRDRSAYSIDQCKENTAKVNRCDREPRGPGKVHNAQIMDYSPNPLIPNRAHTLEVLRLMGDYRPILMLPGESDGYGTRWLLDGEQVLPGIAKYLMNSGFIADSGVTEFGARKLTVTESGIRFRENGVLWWKSLGLLQRLKVTILG